MKNMFEVFKEMNEDDIKNHTSNIVASLNIARANKTKIGGEVTMYVDANSFNDIAFSENKLLVLLVVDRKEYERICKK